MEMAKGLFRQGILPHDYKELNFIKGEITFSDGKTHKNGKKTLELELFTNIPKDHKVGIFIEDPIGSIKVGALVKFYYDGPLKTNSLRPKAYEIYENSTLPEGDIVGVSRWSQVGYFFVDAEERLIIF